MKYNLLGNTGVLVSELCFGTMTFGGTGRWLAIGQTEQKEANEMMKTVVDNGINFIDTANAYSYGLSEKILGQSIRQLGFNRHDLVIATKVRAKMDETTNNLGLSRLHILRSVDESLERLQTSHIDLLYIHGVDLLTPLEETMRALEDLVRSGKVRYLGVSNHPAWQVMKANAIADKRDWTRFEAMQYYYSIAGRDIEREIVPLALDQKIGLMPWSPLAGGFLSGKFTRANEKAGDSRRDTFDFPPINKEKAYDMIDVMAEIAKNYSVSVAQVAFAWMLKKPAVSSIIIGAKRKEQLLDNIASTNLNLSENEMQKLDEISQLAKEYPGWMLEFQGADRKL